MGFAKPQVSSLHDSSMCGQSIGKPDSNTSFTTIFVVESTVMNLKGVNIIIKTLSLDPFRKSIQVYSTKYSTCQTWSDKQDMENELNNLVTRNKSIVIWMEISAFDYTRHPQLVPTPLCRLHAHLEVVYSIQ